ncbi:aminopeptidase P family protein [Luteithermobacter gelatinilyticus]|uniref:aminopeptidase P family protein n=1 Tax=Luteithermobacter gelatinilyticus TaxID=2582913 RepID=UPI00110594C5|nr:aminopeptidase P family protein [Luteithermobacter gelatinilyticus]
MVKARLLALRQVLREQGLAGFVIPHTDEHQSEYTPAYAERLAWLTGFTGSAGEAAITLSEGAIFVDGRYTLQVRQQVDSHFFTPLKLHEDPMEDWFAARVKTGERIGYDPWLHTRDWRARMSRALAEKGAELVPVAGNPIDALWQDRPAPSAAPAVPHPLAYAGEDSANKRQRLGADLRAKGAEVAVLTLLDSIAWLFNIRGQDVAHTPVVLSFALLYQDGRAKLFLDPAKVTPELQTHLGDGVELLSRDSFVSELVRLSGKKVLVDPRKTHAAVFDRLDDAGAEIITGDDPCILPKARKNSVELKGARSAHLRDAIAMCKFLYWLDREGPKGTVDELTAANKLLRLRQEQPLFQDTSFDTISGAGPNGAIVHYRATPESNRPLQPDMLYLVDSGGQYLDGTTDITRTIVIGSPTEEQKDRFTRVLKGHIALAQARFPKGRSGAHLDSLARKPLWDAGLDYDHGTGHGVGSYLGVHEGPQGISRLSFSTPLEEGMILSNEPGYYKPGEYGIRIENLVVVTESRIDEEERPMLTFETLTYVPIDTRLINEYMMSGAEITWLNIYHAKVRELIAPHLDGEEKAWLLKATESLMAL